jgi:hypothetical protein
MTFIKRKIENADESTPKRAVVTELKLGVAQGTEPQGLLPSSTWNCNFEPEKMTKLFNGTISALAFVNEKGEINTISYLGYSTSSDDKLAGHVGTNIDVSVPAMVPKQAILENVLGIMGKNDAEEQGFIFHDYNLNNPILNLSDVTLPALNLSNKVPDELRADNAFPILTIIPKCYPLGWGKAFPTGKIDDDEVQATCQESEDGLLAWSRTLAHLYNENQGNTVTGAKQMINILPHLPITIRDQWNAALNANHGSPGTVAITTDVRPLFPDDTDAKRVIKAVEAAGQSRWGEFLNGNNTAQKNTFVLRTRHHERGGLQTAMCPNSRKPLLIPRAHWIQVARRRTWQQSGFLLVTETQPREKLPLRMRTNSMNTSEDSSSRA